MIDLLLVAGALGGGVAGVALTAFVATFRPELGQALRRLAGLRPDSNDLAIGGGIIVAVISGWMLSPWAMVAVGGLFVATIGLVRARP